MIDTQERTRAFLESRFPSRWLNACNEAWDMAQRIEFLDWSERVGMIDSYFWGEARRRLTSDEVTAIVNRTRPSLPSSENIQTYAQDCRAMLTGVLMMLRQGTAVNTPEQALCFLLSEDEAHGDAASDWMAGVSRSELEALLIRYPGVAFVFLSVFAEDCAVSFMARDAFWAAMLGTH